MSPGSNDARTEGVANTCATGCFMSVATPAEASATWSKAEQALALLPRLVRDGWRRLLTLGFAAGVLGVGGSFLVRQQFVTTAVFVPQTSGTPHLPASVAGLAAQFGALPSTGQ